jgi:hypothetical protein
MSAAAQNRAMRSRAVRNCAMLFGVDLGMPKSNDVRHIQGNPHRLWHRIAAGRLRRADWNLIPIPRFWRRGDGRARPMDESDHAKLARGIGRDLPERYADTLKEPLPAHLAGLVGRLAVIEASGSGDGERQFRKRLILPEAIEPITPGPCAPRSGVATGRLSRLPRRAVVSTCSRTRAPAKPAAPTTKRAAGLCSQPVRRGYSRRLGDPVRHEQRPGW